METLKKYKKQILFGVLGASAVGAIAWFLTRKSKNTTTPKDGKPSVSTAGKSGSETKSDASPSKLNQEKPGMQILKESLVPLETVNAILKEMYSVSAEKMTVKELEYRKARRAVLNDREKYVKLFEAHIEGFNATVLAAKLIALQKRAPLTEEEFDESYEYYIRNGDKELPTYNANIARLIFGVPAKSTKTLSVEETRAGAELSTKTFDTEVKRMFDAPELAHLIYTVTEFIAHLIQFRIIDTIHEKLAIEYNDLEAAYQTHASNPTVSAELKKMADSFVSFLPKLDAPPANAAPAA